jgi:hypothetical protein
MSTHSSFANIQYPIGGTLSNSVASPIYATSSAEFRSFGGGGNAGGVSMSGGSVKSSGSSVAPASSLSVSMSSTSIYAFAGQNQSVNIPIVSGDAAIAAMTSASSYTTAYSGIGRTTGGGVRGLGGRQNVGSMGGGSTSAGSAIENSWLAWMANYGIGMDGVTPNEDGSYGFDYYQLQNAYNEWVAWWKTWNMGSDCPSFDDFLTWFWKNDGKHSWTGDPTNENSTIFMHWVPVGDILPLLLMAMLYALIFFVRRNKTIQL